MVSRTSTPLYHRLPSAYYNGRVVARSADPGRAVRSGAANRHSSARKPNREGTAPGSPKTGGAMTSAAGTAGSKPSKAKPNNSKAKRAKSYPRPANGSPGRRPHAGPSQRPDREHKSWGMEELDSSINELQWLDEGKSEGKPEGKSEGKREGKSGGKSAHKSTVRTRKK